MDRMWGAHPSLHPSQCVLRGSRKAWHNWSEISCFSSLFILLSASRFFFRPFITFLPLFYLLLNKQEIKKRKKRLVRRSRQGLTHLRRSLLYLLCNISYRFIVKLISNVSSLAVTPPLVSSSFVFCFVSSTKKIQKRKKLNVGNKKTMTP